MGVNGQRNTRIDGRRSLSTTRLVQQFQLQTWIRNLELSVLRLRSSRSPRVLPGRGPLRWCFSGTRGRLGLPDGRGIFLRESLLAHQSQRISVSVLLRLSGSAQEDDEELGQVQVSGHGLQVPIYYPVAEDAIDERERAGCFEEQEEFLPWLRLNSGRRPPAGPTVVWPLPVAVWTHQLLQARRGTRPVVVLVGVGELLFQVPVGSTYNGRNDALVLIELVQATRCHHVVDGQSLRQGLAPFGHQHEDSVVPEPVLHLLRK